MCESDVWNGFTIIFCGQVRSHFFENIKPKTVYLNILFIAGEMKL